MEIIFLYGFHKSFNFFFSLEILISLTKPGEKFLISFSRELLLVLAPSSGNLLGRKPLAAFVSFDFLDLS